MSKTKKSKKSERRSADVVRSFAPPFEFETYREIGPYERGQMEHKEPSCFNGIVSVVKYRVRVEKVEESIDVIHARLLRLWEESNNHHDYHPLQSAAKQFGLELPGETFGRWRRK